jgi:hypothetical protein
MRKTTELALEALARSFSVADLMVSVEQLVRADSLDEARALFGAYDFVPYPSSGPIEGWFRKDVEDGETLDPGTLLSDSTSLIELPRFLALRPAYLVLRGNVVGGLVHFSDLNNPLMKLPLYVLFEAVESELLPALNKVLEEGDLKAVLSRKRFGEVLKRRTRLQAERSELGWAQGMHCGELLALAKRRSIIELPDNEVHSLNDLRNKVTHADRLLIEANADVQNLDDVRGAFERLNDLLNKLPSAA